MAPPSSTARMPSLPEPPLDLHNRRLDLVNTVTPCILALVNVPRHQSPQLVARPPGPSVQAQHPSFTAPGPSARTRMTFTFAADHCLRLPRLHTTSQETRCTTQLTQSVDNHSSSSSNHKDTYQPCVRNLPLDECIVNTKTRTPNQKKRRRITTPASPQEEAETGSTPLAKRSKISANRLALKNR